MGHLKDYDKYLKELTCSNFVETGCYMGQGLKKAKEHFSNLYSCDTSEKYVKKCRKLFPDAHIYNLDSLLFLEEICKTLKGQTVFWLDAHYPTQYDSSVEQTKQNKFPLDEEIKTIKKFKEGYENDIILCDDLRVVQSEDNPVRGDIGLRHLREEHLVLDKTFSSYTNILEDTHTYELVGLDGLIFIPK